MYKKHKTLKIHGTYFLSFAKIYLSEYLSTLVAGCEDALSINKTALLGMVSESRRLHTQKSLQSIPENLLLHPIFLGGGWNNQLVNFLLFFKRPRFLRFTEYKKVKFEIKRRNAAWQNCNTFLATLVSCRMMLQFQILKNESKDTFTFWPSHNRGYCVFLFVCLD